MSALNLFRRRELGIIMLAALLFAGASASLAAELHQTVEFNRVDFTFGKMAGYDIVKWSGSYLNEPGEPRLPALQIRIALPDGMRADAVSVDAVRTETVEGEYNILPAQPPLRISDDQDKVEFVQPDPATYNSDKLYPENRAWLIDQADLAGQSFATVEVVPFQYDPRAGRLILATSLEIVITGSNGYVCGDYLPVDVSPRTESFYRDQLASLVVNREAVQLRESPLPLLKSRALPDSGPFDHLIITTQSLSTPWLPLANWHTRKGVRDTVITTEYIYANYSGASNQEKIRNFLIDAHDNWGTLYVLIGGENEQVPFEYRTYESESIPSDELYADIDNDWQMELLVGRVTASNATEISRFIDKLLTYETDPPTVNYALTATILGMDLTTEWQPPYYTLTASEETKELIDTTSIPSNFTVTKVYDSQSSNHYSDFVNALDAGAHLVNHSDHSNTTVMGTGDLNHGWYISNGTVDALTNTDKLSVIFSLGCHPNEMDYNDCIAEHFVVYNAQQGAVAFTGNTRSGWFYVGDPNSLSSILDIKWWEGLFDFNMYHLGQALAYAKQHAAHGDNYERYCQWTLNILGEPEMPIWTYQPFKLYAFYPDSITTSPAEITVHTSRSHGLVVDSALVCLWKEGEVYERGYTNDSGDVTFSIVATSGQLHVTAGKQNHIPFIGELPVNVTNTAPECIVPNDSLIMVRGTAEICLPVGCYDPDGNLNGGPTIVSGPGEIADGSWCYTPAGSEVCDVTVRCTDIGGLFCETGFQIQVEMFSCGDADGSGIVNISDAVALIGFIFGGNPAPVPFAAGDVDCNDLVNIADAVYLISFIFGDGAPPCDGC